MLVKKLSKYEVLLEGFTIFSVNFMFSILYLMDGSSWKLSPVQTSRDPKTLFTIILAEFTSLLSPSSLSISLLASGGNVAISTSLSHLNLNYLIIPMLPLIPETFASTWISKGKALGWEKIILLSVTRLGITRRLYAYRPTVLFRGQLKNNALQLI